MFTGCIICSVIGLHSALCCKTEYLSHLNIEKRSLLGGAAIHSQSSVRRTRPSGTTLHRRWRAPNLAGPQGFFAVLLPRRSEARKLCDWFRHPGNVWTCRGQDPTNLPSGPG